MFGSILSPVEVTPWDPVIKAIGTDVQLAPVRLGDRSQGGSKRGEGRIISGLRNGLTDPAKVQRGW